MHLLSTARDDVEQFRNTPLVSERFHRADGYAAFADDLQRFSERGHRKVRRDQPGSVKSEPQVTKRHHEAVSCIRLAESNRVFEKYRMDLLVQHVSRGAVNSCGLGRIEDSVIFNEVSETVKPVHSRGRRKRLYPRPVSDRSDVAEIEPASGPLVLIEHGALFFGL